MDEKKEKKTQVREMFNEISFHYDFLNHFLSFGTDYLWRRKAIRLLRKNKPKSILDVATGTGDMAILASKLKPEKIVGIDISEKMLEIGIKKVLKNNLQDVITLQTGDSESLEFPENTFDAVMVAFGVRNFANLSQGLGEMYRVLNQGGQVIILEFSKPEVFPVKQFYQFYSKYILPFLGNKIAGNSRAYTYLPDSIAKFPSGNDFLTVMMESGFKRVTAQKLSFGISTIYSGYKQ